MIEAEKALLSLLLNNPEQHVGVDLEPFEFSSGDNKTPNTRAVFTAFQACIDDGVLPEPTLIAQKAKMSPSYVKKFFGVEYEVENLSEYVRLIRTETIKGEIKRLGLTIAALSEQSFDPKTVSEQIRAEVAKAKIEVENVDTERASLGSILDRVVATAEKNKDIPLSERSVETPFYDFNRHFGTLFYGDYSVFAGDTGMGKTSLVQDIVSHALKRGKKVVSFALEMSKEQLVQRQISKLSGLSMLEIRTGSYFKDPEKKRRWFTAVEELNQYRDNWFIFDAEYNQLLQILATARKLVLQGAELIVVDYLQLIEYPKYKDNRALQVGMASQALARFGKSTGDKAHVIALAQLNRKVTDRQDKRPTKGDLKDSSQIEQSADMLIFVYRDAFYNPETELGDIAELEVAKNRNGQTGMVKLLWDGSTTTFRNLDNDRF